MEPFPSHSSVNLPSHTRGQAARAARAGAKTPQEIDAMLRTGITDPEKAVRAVESTARHSFRKIGETKTEKDGGEAGDTVTIATAEYNILSSVARLLGTFMPMLEKAGAPVQRPTEWNMLREKMKLLGRVGATASAAETDAVLGLLNAERLLADE